MNEMSPPAANHQWYLARDGQQYGPLAELELVKFIELGHLHPNDLVWREGFPDWRPALLVFPPRRPATQRPPSSSGFPGEGPRARAPGRGQHERSMQSQAPRGRPLPGAQVEPYEDDPPRVGRLKKLMVLLLCLGAVAAVGWFAYPQRKMLIDYMTTLPSRLSGLLGGDGTRASGDRRNMDVSPLKGFTSDLEGVDTTLQATPLWRILKREFPDWYADRVKEAASLAAQNRDEASIAQHMASAVVALRRQNAKHALAASFPLLKAVATSFHTNLERLRKHSPQACFDFISKGEASPTIILLMQNPTHAAYLQAQLADVFEAIAEGRKSPRVYPQPRKADYDTLAADLNKRGWSQADLRMFTDERALSSAGPEKVCQMVHDWFAAQLAMSDPDVQLRLLVDSLRPVVAG
jgi:hypothetical protein